MNMEIKWNGKWRKGTCRRRRESNPVKKTQMTWSFPAGSREKRILSVRFFSKGGNKRKTILKGWRRTQQIRGKRLWMMRCFMQRCSVVETISMDRPLPPRPAVSSLEFQQEITWVRCRRHFRFGFPSGIREIQKWINSPSGRIFKSPPSFYLNIWLL